MNPRVSIEELSRFLDGEVSPDERRDIESRLKECKTSQQLFTRLKSATGAISGAIFRQAAARKTDVESPGEDCLDDDTLLKLAEEKLSADEKQAVEAHIVQCPVCLDAALEHVRLAAGMNSGAWPELPPEALRKKEVQFLVHALAPAQKLEVWEKVQLNLSAEHPEANYKLLHDDISMEFLAKLMSPGIASVTIFASISDCVAKNEQLSISNSETKKKFFSGYTDDEGKLFLSRIPCGKYFGRAEKLEFGFELKIEEIQ